MPTIATHQFSESDGLWVENGWLPPAMPTVVAAIGLFAGEPATA